MYFVPDLSMDRSEAEIVVCRQEETLLRHVPRNAGIASGSSMLLLSPLGATLPRPEPGLRRLNHSPESLLHLVQAPILCTTQNVILLQLQYDLLEKGRS